MDTKDNQRYQSGHASTIDIILSRKVALEDSHGAVVPDGGNVKRYRMNQAEEETDIAAPSM